MNEQSGPDWYRQAQCGIEGSAELFFGPEYPEKESPDARAAREAKAIAICGRCAVVSACAESAIRDKEVYGVRGGMTERKIRKIIKAKNSPLRKRRYNAA